MNATLRARWPAYGTPADIPAWGQLFPPKAPEPSKGGPEKEKPAPGSKSARLCETLRDCERFCATMIACDRLCEIKSDWDTLRRSEPRIAINSLELRWQDRCRGPAAHALLAFSSTRLAGGAP